MCVCEGVYVGVCTTLNLYERKSVCISLMYVRVYIRVYAFLCVCMRVPGDVHMHACACVCT